MNVQTVLAQFADMAQKSRAPDGDRQGDGWGVAWYAGGWQVKKSIRPIWEDRAVFSEIPDTLLFAVHARSASFPAHKNIIQYNQPYISGDLCFVFNGVIEGVTISRPLAGTIGAQKIFSLLCEEIKGNTIESALRTVDTTLVEHSRKIHGCNIGLVTPEAICALCRYGENSVYFSLNYYRDDTVNLVCSEPIGQYAWQTMQKGEIQTFT